MTTTLTATTDADRISVVLDLLTRLTSRLNTMLANLTPTEKENEHADHTN